MSVLSVLYLSDLRWVFVAAKPEPEPPQYEREASPPAYVSIDPVAVVVEKSLEKAVKQQSHIWNGPQTSRIPPTAARFAIDNPYTWQPPSPPPPEEGKLQHSRSDPTPHLQHPAYPDGFKHRLYKHENISSSYLKGCRLTTPWTTEFVVSGEEEGEGESGSSIRDDGGGDGLELPPRLSTLVKRRWSSDVLRGGGGGVGGGGKRGKKGV